MRWRPGAIEALVLSGLCAVLLYSGVALARWQPETSAAGTQVPPGVASRRAAAEQGYDDAPCQSDGESPPLSSAGLSVFPLLSEVTFDTGEGSPTQATVEGSGTLLFSRFVLTVAHAVTLDRLEATVRTHRGEMKIPLDARRISETTYLLHAGRRLPLALLARKEDADIALFLLPEGVSLPTFPYPIGDSEALELGDHVALLESDMVAGVLFRPASVAGLRGSAAVAALSRNEGVFLFSMALTSGESGAPILAVRKGAYELVGLAQGTYIGPRQLAWGIRIGHALEALAREAPTAEIRKFLQLCCHAATASLSGPCAFFSAGRT